MANTIEAQWKQFLAMCFKGQLPAHVEAEYRKSFYAGVAVAFEAMCDASSTKPETEALKRVAELHNEIQDALQRIDDVNKQRN